MVGRVGLAPLFAVAAQVLFVRDRTAQRARSRSGEFSVDTRLRARTLL